MGLQGRLLEGEVRGGVHVEERVELLAHQESDGGEHAHAAVLQLYLAVEAHLDKG